MSPRLMTVTLATLGAAAAAPAAADADAPVIAWRAPAGCPGAADLHGRVVAQLGRALRPGEVDARLEVSRHGARWRVDLTVRTAAGEGERTLEAASCDELADAAALIVALTIDADARPGGGDDPPAAAPPAAAPATVATRGDRDDDDGERPPVADLERRYVDVPVREPAAPRPFELRIRALVAGDLGSLPRPAIGVGGAVEVALGPWTVDVGGQHFAEQDARVPGSATQGASVDLTALVARGCYVSGSRRWRAGGCIGGELWLMRVEGFEFSDNFPATTTYGAGLHTGATWALALVGPLTVRADVTATWMGVRPVLTEADVGTVIHDPNVLVWRGVAALEAGWR